LSGGKGKQTAEFAPSACVHLRYTHADVDPEDCASGTRAGSHKATFD
jgi:hypothetical protein